jgi:hypothetical protein
MFDFTEYMNILKIDTFSLLNYLKLPVHQKQQKNNLRSRIEKTNIY